MFFISKPIINQFLNRLLKFLNKKSIAIVLIQHIRLSKSNWILIFWIYFILFLESKLMHRLDAKNLIQDPPNCRTWDNQSFSIKNIKIYFVIKNNSTYPLFSTFGNLISKICSELFPAYSNKFWFWVQTI